MAYLIFAKTIADMFYAFSWLDYLLMGVAVIFFILSFRKHKDFHTEDFFAFVFMALLCLTMVRTGTGFNHFVKMLSGFMLYFIGRGYYSEVQPAEKALVVGNYIVVLTNLAMFLLGIGFVTWGSASTFRGIYYYKTDFSIAMIYALSAFMFFRNTQLGFAVIEWVVISYLILRSNTRAAMLILVLVFGLWILYLHERKTQKPVRINIKYVIGIALGLVVALFLVVRVLSLPVFAQYHFISFNFNSLSDLFNTSNTQGRNIIWDSLLMNYRRAGWLKRAIGIDFISDSWNGLDAHNAYLKILFSTGYIGLAAFLGFLVFYIRRLNRLKDRSLFYFNLSILITFIVQSMTQSSIDFTQMTWVFLFFAGAAVSESYQHDTEEYRFNKERRIVFKWNKGKRMPGVIAYRSELAEK